MCNGILSSHLHTPALYITCDAASFDAGSLHHKHERLCTFHLISHTELYKLHAFLDKSHKNSLMKQALSVAVSIWAAVSSTSQPNSLMPELTHTDKNRP